MTQALTLEQFNRLTPFYSYWDSLKKTGSVSNLQDHEKHIMNDVHFELLGIRSKLSCNNCVLEMLTYVYMQYDKFKAANLN